MKLHTLTLVIWILVLFSTTVVGAGAQEARPTPAPVPITVTRAWLQGNEERSDAGFRSGILVEVEHLSKAVQQDKLNPRDFVLYLDGQALKGVKVAGIEEPTNPEGPTRLAFKLERTEDSNQTWRSLLGSPGWKDNYREVGVSVGFPDKEAIPQSTSTYRPVIYLRVYDRWWAVGSLIFLILMIGAFIALAITKNVIRDSNPPDPPKGKKKPYSLALTQAAWWFVLVIGSFVFIYMITGDYNTMTDQALILMGIGISTALGAFMINATKRDTADTQLSALLPEKAKLETEVSQLRQPNANADPVVLAEKQAKLDELEKQIDDAKAGLSKPVSEGFVKDLLTDVNGITLHRFQMVIWTVVLGAIFLIGVYRDLAMPAFSGTLLALMGISAGTYLGFKIPERQTDPKEEQNP